MQLVFEIQPIALRVNAKERTEDKELMKVRPLTGAPGGPVGPGTPLKP